MLSGAVLFLGAVTKQPLGAIFLSIIAITVIVLLFLRWVFSNIAATERRMDDKFPNTWESEGRTYDASYGHRTDQPGFKRDAVEEEWSASRRTTGQTPHSSVLPAQWSLDLLRELEWKRFEEVALKLYQLQGYKARTTHTGADGGVDIIVYVDGTNGPLSLIQCKAWNTRPVGVKPVRELLGVLAHNKVKHGIFMTTDFFINQCSKNGTNDWC